MAAQITEQMKKAALAGAVRAAMAEGHLKIAKQEFKKASVDNVKKMASILKQAGVTKREIIALSFAEKAAAALRAEPAFKKVASATGVDLKLVKTAYLQKHAIGWLAPLLIGGAGGLAFGAANQAMNPANYMARDFQMSPARRAFYRQVMGTARQNRELSQDLQAMSGAYHPAPNPWGPQGMM